MKAGLVTATPNWVSSSRWRKPRSVRPRSSPFYFGQQNVNGAMENPDLPNALKSSPTSFFIAVQDGAAARRLAPNVFVHSTPRSRNSTLADRPHWEAISNGDHHPFGYSIRAETTYRSQHSKAQSVAERPADESWLESGHTRQPRLELGGRILSAPFGTLACGPPRPRSWAVS
jgi:hypothetical protein